MKTYELRAEPYDTGIRVVVGTPAEARKWKSKSAYSDVEYSFEVKGALLYCETHWPILFINSEQNKNQRIRTFAHECIHVINHIFSRAGVISHEGNDEQYAYFIDYLFRQAQEKKII